MVGICLQYGSDRIEFRTYRVFSSFLHSRKIVKKSTAPKTDSPSKHVANHDEAVTAAQESAINEELQRANKLLEKVQKVRRNVKDDVSTMC